MKFRIIEQENFFYIEKEVSAHGVTIWVPLKSNGNILYFNSIKNAETYINKTYVKPKKSVVKEITI